MNINSKKQKKFLKKVVDVVDDMLYERNLGDEVTVDWSKKKCEITLEHDEYGILGTWSTSEACKNYYHRKKNNEYLIKTSFIRHEIGLMIVNKAVDMIKILSKEDPDLDDEDFDDEEESGRDFCNGHCSDCHHSDFCDEYEEENIEDFEDFDEDDDDDFDLEEYHYNDEFEVLGENDDDESKVKEEEVPPAPIAPATVPVCDVAVSYVTCPNCKSDNIRKNGRKNGIQRYICRDCGRYFSDTTLA